MFLCMSFTASNVDFVVDAEMLLCRVWSADYWSVSVVSRRAAMAHELLALCSVRACNDRQLLRSKREVVLLATLQIRNGESVNDINLLSAVGKFDCWQLWKFRKPSVCQLTQHVDLNFFFYSAAKSCKQLKRKMCSVKAGKGILEYLLWSECRDCYERLVCLSTN
jgi:hypothetical protein